MEVSYHRLFQRDIDAGVRHYDNEGGEVLGDRFFSEVERAVEMVVAHPTSFHFIAEGYRCAQLKRFPYHIILLEISNFNRIGALRKRPPIKGPQLRFKHEVQRLLVEESVSRGAGSSWRDWN